MTACRWLCLFRDDVFVLRSLTHITHFLHQQDATVLSRHRQKLLHTLLCLLASLQVGCHCMKVHEIHRCGAWFPSARLPLSGHHLRHFRLRGSGHQKTCSEVLVTTTAARACSPASRLHRPTVYLQYSFRTSTCSARPFCSTMKWLACRPISQQSATRLLRGAGVATRPRPSEVSGHVLDGQPFRALLTHGRNHIFELPHHAGRHPYSEPAVLSWQHSWFEDSWLVARIHLVLDFWSPRSPRASLLVVADPESHVLFHPLCRVTGSR